MAATTLGAKPSSSEDDDDDENIDCGQSYDGDDLVIWGGCPEATLNRLHRHWRTRSSIEGKQRWAISHASAVCHRLLAFDL